MQSNAYIQTLLCPSPRKSSLGPSTVVPGAAGTSTWPFSCGRGYSACGHTTGDIPGTSWTYMLQLISKHIKTPQPPPQKSQMAKSQMCCVFSFSWNCSDHQNIVCSVHMHHITAQARLFQNVYATIFDLWEKHSQKDWCWRINLTYAKSAFSITSCLWSSYQKMVN